jgi:hypothetical protein
VICTASQLVVTWCVCTYATPTGSVTRRQCNSCVPSHMQGTLLAWTAECCSCALFSSGGCETDYCSCIRDAQNCAVGTAMVGPYVNGCPTDSEVQQLHQGCEPLTGFALISSHRAVPLPHDGSVNTRLTNFLLPRQTMPLPRAVWAASDALCKASQCPTRLITTYSTHAVTKGWCNPGQHLGGTPHIVPHPSGGTWPHTRMLKLN